MPMLVELEAKEVICRLPGGASSLLVKSQYGQLMVLKSASSAQGPNVLANEWLGSQVLELLGLRSRVARPMRLPTSFNKRFERNQYGLAFDFIEHRDDRWCFEWLPSNLLSKLANAEDFVGALVLDCWAGSTDRRQALYVGAPGDWFTAVFIDNGQLFGSTLR